MPGADLRPSPSCPGKGLSLPPYPATATWPYMPPVGGRERGEPSTTVKAHSATWTGRRRRGRNTETLSPQIEISSPSKRRQYSPGPVPAVARLKQELAASYKTGVARACSLRQLLSDCTVWLCPALSYSANRCKSPFPAFCGDTKSCHQVVPKGN